MAGEVSTGVSKPTLRGLHQASVKKHLGIAIGMVVVAGVVFQFGRNSVRQNDYAEFYKTYDDQKIYERMRDNGLLQSAPQ